MFCVCETNYNNNNKNTSNKPAKVCVRNHKCECVCVCFSCHLSQFTLSHTDCVIGIADKHGQARQTYGKFSMDAIIMSFTRLMTSPSPGPGLYRKFANQTDTLPISRSIISAVRPFPAPHSARTHRQKPTTKAEQEHKLFHLN